MYDDEAIIQARLSYKDGVIKKLFAKYNEFLTKAEKKGLKDWYVHFPC